jgi:hypothetical protein
MLNSPSHNLPADVQERFSSEKVADVCVASFGDTSDRYFFSLEVKGETDESERSIVSCYGGDCSETLKEYVNEVAGRGDLPYLKVVLGPRDSFFAWDRVSMKWEGVPRGFESVIQKWLSPMGWKSGPPRIVAFGKDGAYFVKSEYGAWGLQSNDEGAMSLQFERLQKQDKIKDIEVSS